MVGGARGVVGTARRGALTATKWRLATGLEVILLADPAATSVSYMTWFRVGSRHQNEAAGQTGLAHLFEHLMFTPTKQQKAGAFDGCIESAAGSANTNSDSDLPTAMGTLPAASLALSA